jgi:hypothetical protein
LRTGDLGFQLDGELFVTGRQKDLIITRGQNLYPEDIEVAVKRCSTAVRAGCVAAFGLEAGVEQGIAVALEVATREPVDLDALIIDVREAVTRELSIPLSAIVLLRQGGLPKTSSGKLQRHACSEEYAATPSSTRDQYRAESRTRPPHCGTRESDRRRFRLCRRSRDVRGTCLKSAPIREFIEPSRKQVGGSRRREQALITPSCWSSTSA